MTTVQKTVTVEKEWSEVGDAIVAIARAVKVAKSDGWNTTQDLPAVLLASFQPLLTAFNGAEQLVAEFQESPEGCVLAMAISAKDVVESLKG